MRTVPVTLLGIVISFALLLGPATPVIAQPTPPIIDLHFHPELGWDLGALVSLMDQIGVTKAGNGPGGPDSLAISSAARYPNKFIPFCALGELIFHLQQGGSLAWDLQDDGMNGYLRQLEQRLRSRQCRGLGEVYPNNLHTYGNHPELRSLYPADSPLMRRLFSFSASYGVPLSVHMEPDHPSVAQLERLLSSNAQGILIWAHAGFADPPLLRSLFQQHSNLSCDLALYYGRFSAGPSIAPTLFPEWKYLFEEFPERFVLGTDVSQHSLDAYSSVVEIWRAILAQLTPDTAEKIAHLNAERILKISSSTR